MRYSLLALFVLMTIIALVAAVYSKSIRRSALIRKFNAECTADSRFSLNDFSNGELEVMICAPSLTEADIAFIKKIAPIAAIEVSDTNFHLDDISWRSLMSTDAIRQLKCIGNSLSLEAWESFALAKHLEDIQVMTDSLPESVGNALSKLRELRKIDILCNSISEIEIVDLPNLLKCRVQFDGGRTTIQRCPGLDTVVVSSLTADSAFSVRICELPALRSLNCWLSNYWESGQQCEIQRCPNIRWIALNAPSINERFFELGGCRQIEAASLSGGTISVLQSLLRMSPRVHRVELEGINDKAVLDRLSAFNELTELTLWNCSFDDREWSSLKNCKSLHLLRIVGEVNGNLQPFAQCRSLEQLDLSNATTSPVLSEWNLNPLQLNHALREIVVPIDGKKICKADLLPTVTVLRNNSDNTRLMSWEDFGFYP